MILKIILTKPNVNIPVNNQHYVNGFFHKVLGENNKWHDTFSEYAISSLQGGTFNNGYLTFKKEPYFIISSENPEFIDTVMDNITKVDANIFGMVFKGMKIQDYLVNKYFDKVITISPILLKEKSTNRHVTVQDSDFIDVLTKNCVNKLRHEGIEDKSFKIEIRNPEKAKKKKITVGKVENICSMVSLVVYGKKETRNTLYNLGLGHSTGCGFGTIKIYETASSF